MADRARQYAERLERLQLAPWKRALRVQAPYGWNLRRLRPGLTLEVGCGIGRNLEHLFGAGVGVDDNPYVVEAARRRGFRAYSAEEFPYCEYATPGRFDSLLFAHVLEHMTHDEAIALVGEFRGYIRSRGQLILICPQERGYASDATHVEFADFPALADICEKNGGRVTLTRSFPLPRALGRSFVYNEFVVVAELAE